MSWLFGGKKTLNKISDKVWVNKKYKIEGLIHDLGAIKPNEIKILCCFFQETIFECKDMLKQNSIHFELVEEYGYLEMKSSIFVMDVNSFKTSSKPKEFLKKFENQRIQFLFLEHYPLYSKEKEILDKLELTITKQVESIFYLSLDEPILQVFGGDRINDILGKLGLAEGESIQHSMISSSIVNVQEKIEKEIRIEHKTDSMKEWFERNKIYNR